MSRCLEEERLNMEKNRGSLVHHLLKPLTFLILLVAIFPGCLQYNFPLRESVTIDLDSAFVRVTSYEFVPAYRDSIEEGIQELRGCFAQKSDTGQADPEQPRFAFNRNDGVFYESVEKFQVAETDSPDAWSANLAALRGFFKDIVVSHGEVILPCTPNIDNIPNLCWDVRGDPRVFCTWKNQILVFPATQRRITYTVYYDITHVYPHAGT